MSRTSKRSSVRMPTLAENRAIVAAAKADPNAKPLSAAQLKKMVPAKSLRGRPKAANKKLLVSVRYSPEVIDYFKSTGDGWQARMDGVLLRYVSRQSKAA